jgi:hypothetical protein
LFTFVRFGRTRRNDPDVFAAIGVYDNENAPRRAHAERDEPLLVRIGFVVGYRDRVGIVKDRNRLRKTNAMPAKVDSGFVLLVPLEPAHVYIVPTLCAYVNTHIYVANKKAELYARSKKLRKYERPIGKQKIAWPVIEIVVRALKKLGKAAKSDAAEPVNGSVFSKEIADNNTSF